jgi:hypothetical protein
MTRAMLLVDWAMPSAPPVVSALDNRVIRDCNTGLPKPKPAARAATPGSSRPRPSALAMATIPNSSKTAARIKSRASPSRRVSGPTRPP